MRHAYRTSAWEGHCKSDYHIDAVRNYEAMKANKKNIHHNKQGQSSMLAFFNIKEKKKSATTTNPVPTHNVTNVDEAEVNNVDEEEEKKNIRTTR